MEEGPTANRFRGQPHADGSLLHPCSTACGLVFYFGFPMSRETTDADQVVMAVREHGLEGAFIDSSEYGKHVRIAKAMLKNLSLKRILYVIENGTDIWPFSEGPWDVFDLKRHWPKAYARAVQVYRERHQRERDLPDLRSLLAREQEWEEAHG